MNQKAFFVKFYLAHKKKADKKSALLLFNPSLV